jgi:hypothetical protein
MKQVTYILLLSLLPLLTMGQYSWKSYSLSATGGAQSNSSYSSVSSLQHYEASGNNNNTYSGNSGFLHPAIVLIIPDIDLGLKAYLEGAYNGTEMNTDIKNLLPNNQPYNVSPWAYSGTESFTSLPNQNIVDWVLIEIRDAANASSADNSTIVARQAGFLLNDGSVVAADGSSHPRFTLSISQNLFVVIYHRNHLSVLSNYALSQSGGVYTYDFTDNVNKAYGGSNAHKNLGSGIYGLFSGDANADGNISNNDKVIWTNHSGQNAYHASDMNLDGEINNPDKNDVWFPNTGQTSQVPQ